MEEKNFRIRTTPGGNDKVLNISLNQSFDYLEILSLKISKSDFYKTFTSDYGVLVGRVIANDGLGVPNANVSIFIPLTEEDADNPRISHVYPFTRITDRDENNAPYNLLIPEKYNVGRFPSKQQILDDDTYVEVYEKYYKYTTKTNQAGDYMIFGVPVGHQTIHMDLDLSNIGIFSYSPNDLMGNGVPENLFTKTSKNSYTFKESYELSSLPQIITQDSSVDIKPLWGNVEENEIGITRFDFKIQVTSSPVATFAVNIGIDQYINKVGKTFGVINNRNNLRNYNGSNDGITGDRPGEVDKLFPFVTNDGVRSYGEPYFRVKKYNVDDPDDEGFETTMYKLVKDAETDKAGIMILHLPCDQDKYITDEYGNSIRSLDDSKGIGTTGRYSIEIICDAGRDLGIGEYWGYKIENENRDLVREPFVFQSKRIYSASMKFRNNRNNVDKDFVIRSAANYNTPYPSNSFKRNDWLNCFLYFGRMGNSDEYKETSIPTQLLYESEGVNYYDIQTRFIDITDYFHLLAEHNTYYLEVDATDEKYITKDVAIQDESTITTTDNTQQALPLNNTNRNKKVFFMGARQGWNNFRTFQNIIDN